MSDPTTTPDAARARPRRSTPLLWTSGAVAAAVLVLGTNGTLSSWTAAVLTNDTNTVVTAQAVILSETDGVATCSSSDDASNTFTCTTINKYGGTSTPLTPGDNQTVDVTFSNIGGADAATFALTPGACSQTPTAGSGTPAAADLCTNGDLTVEVGCAEGLTYGITQWGDLAYPEAAPPTATLTHTDSAGELAAGESWTCRFTVLLSYTATVLAQGVEVTQPLTWTLST